jgi:hypothetical protein
VAEIEVELKMQRIKTACTGFGVAAASMVLLTGISIAEDGVEARAERVCTLIAQTGTRFQGAFDVDDLNIQTEVNGTVTLKRGGIKLGEIGQKSYIDHTVCLVEVMALISSRI